LAKAAEAAEAAIAGARLDARTFRADFPIFETVASCPSSTSFSSTLMYGYVSERDSSSRISASQTTFDFEPVAPFATSSRPR